MGAMCTEPSQNWVGIYFHDPLPSDVRRQNYIPLFQTSRGAQTSFKSHISSLISPSKSCCSQLSWSRASVFVYLFLLNKQTKKSLLYQSGPVRARGSHFLLGYRLSTLALSQFQSINFTARCFSDHKAPQCDLSAAFLRRDIQRKSLSKGH